jgi:hypothetical protein
VQDSAVRVYRLSSETRRVANRYQLLSAVVAAGMLLFVFGASAVLLESVPPMFWLLPLVGAGALVAGVIRGRSKLRAQEALWGLALGPDVIRIVTADAPPIEMTRDEVTRALEAPSGLALQAEQPPRQLFVLRTVERYDEVRAAIAAWRPLEQVGSERGKVLRLLLWQAIGILAFVGAIFVADVRVSAVASAVLLALLAFGGRAVLRDRFFPPTLRQVALLCLGVATLALVARWALYLYAGGSR